MKKSKMEKVKQKEGEMKRLLLVSNRLPVTVSKRKSKLNYKFSEGGLATGLKSFHDKFTSVWIGWCGMPTDNLKKDERCVVSDTLEKDYNCHSVFLSRRQIQQYYYGFSNKTLWPLFHYFSDYAQYDDSQWGHYKSVNKVFSDILSERAGDEDTIWIHDYHLFLLPELVRKNFPNAPLGFFLHIPFPSYEIFRLLPWRKELLQGMLGADLIGFHTYDYVQHFLESVRNICGYEHSLGYISVEDRIVKADAYPMGIDFAKFSNAPQSPEVKREIKRLLRDMPDQKIILSVDRLDYTKGILHRLHAFDYFLDNNPQFRGKVSLLAIAVPSRTNVGAYRELKRQLDELIGYINGKHGMVNWIPVRYFYRSFPFHILSAFYNISDVALVTPIRDGMNLIAKEYVAAKTDGSGSLILSEMTGAAKELGEAYIVNPNNLNETANAIKRALESSIKVQKKQMGAMRERLERYDVGRWANEFMLGLSNVKERQQQRYRKKLSREVKEEFVTHYTESKRRLLMLDYEGTLIPSNRTLKQARPDKELTDILQMLTQDEKNEIILISGRQRSTLEDWFSGFDLSFIAENGAWIKKKGNDWKILKNLDKNWKRELRNIVQLHADRTPGSTVEEKEFSLVFQYQKADPKLASVRTAELKEALLALTAHQDLGILEGSKRLEIKNPSINKGAAAASWLVSENWDFILAAGDEWTDEELFNSLPEFAYSLKVGWKPTSANYNIDSYLSMRSILKRFCKTSGAS